MPNLDTCQVCKADFEEDDTVWADAEGNTEIHQYAYCVACLPPQPEVDDVIKSIEEASV
jgi:hypothetical protein